METVYMPLQWAPSTLNQPILPNWSFHLFNVNLGSSSNAALEQAVLDNVGSYGKQLGHLAEALEVVIAKLQANPDVHFSPDERDSLTVFLADVAAVRKLKDSQG